MGGYKVNWPVLIVLLVLTGIGFWIGPIFGAIGLLIVALILAAPFVRSGGGGGGTPPAGRPGP